MRLFLILSSVGLSLPHYSRTAHYPAGNVSCHGGRDCGEEEETERSCLAGFYCPEGSVQPVPCPPGTYSSAKGALSVENCRKCPVDFFNHLRGQLACFPCGSKATQPEEGQETCLCFNPGQVFQPSDAQCPCAPGFQHRADGVEGCIRVVHDICRDGSTRNQDGTCMAKEEWASYCSDQVCASPEDYQGYDKVLGLCACRSEDLDSVCGPKCRRRQKRLLQHRCEADGDALYGMDSNGTQMVFPFDDGKHGILHLQRAVNRQPCIFNQSNPQSVYVVKTNAQGFAGLYNPYIELMSTFFTTKPNTSSKLHMVSTYSAKEENVKSSLARAEQTLQLDLVPEYPSIPNPTTCINVNDFILFIISKHHFPVYDVNNLYNTNPRFDWGEFRNLAVEVEHISRNVMFFYQFQQSGVYIFRLSSNQHKRMYIRVMPIGGQCYEDGPFFPTTPRHVIRVGIARTTPLLLKPDWPAIIGITLGLMAILIVVVLLLVCFENLSWPKRSATCPHFRSLQLKYNFDSYASKGATVTFVKKHHPRLRARGWVCSESDGRDTNKYTSGSWMEHNDFWDYDTQVDLECFNTNMFFQILLRQSQSVTAKLSQLKEELKVFYQKLLKETCLIRELCVMKLSTAEPAKPCASTLMESYLQKKEEAELEICRRQKLAEEFAGILKKQLQLFQQDMKDQEEHCVLFDAALREVVRLLETLRIRRRDGETETGDTWCKEELQGLLKHIEAACDRIASAMMKECHRLKSWGLLGEGTGGTLLSKDRTKCLCREDLFASDGSVRAKDAIFSNPESGLLRPTADTVMLSGSNCLIPVPREHFVHLETGRVLPTAGNVGYDPLTSALLATVDSCPGEIRESSMPVFHYIPYPICASTGLPVKTKLPSIQHMDGFNVSGTMKDPVTGMEVSVLAVTIHPQTGHQHTVGGTYTNPITGSVMPIDIGNPMIDLKSGRIVPILGVSLDSNTGDVIPLGGLRNESGEVLFLGDTFREPLSGKRARFQGLCSQQDQVVPHAGGYQALLEANALLAQRLVIDALTQYKESTIEYVSVTKDECAREEHALLAAVQAWKKALSLTQQFVMCRTCKVEKQHELAASLASNGGSLGMVQYPGTELWMPAVYGLEIPDPGGSDLMVPILGVEHDWSTGCLIPLAGTMEDADGNGLVPIRIGGRTIDPVTGQPATVVGAQMDSLTNMVKPSLQSRREKDPHLLEILERELCSRQAFWRCQREKEEELLKDLNMLILEVLYATREGKIQKIKHQRKMAFLEESCSFLETACLSEAQRRTASNLHNCYLLSSGLPLLTKVNNMEEKDQQLRVVLVIRTALEKLMQFVYKVLKEEERLKGQLKEKQKSRNGRAEERVRMKQKKVTLHLNQEFQEHMIKRQAGVDTAYSRLEYLRELSELHFLQAKGFLLGLSPQCLGTYPVIHSQDFRHSSREEKDVRQTLIPLLKHLILTIEQNRSIASAPELLETGSNKGYSSSSTLKASTVNSESFRDARNQEPNHLGVSLMLPLILTGKSSHLHQEQLIRLFMEKHASERIHLELMLMTEEINRIWDFFKTSKVKEHLNVVRTGADHISNYKIPPDIIQQTFLKEMNIGNNQQPKGDWKAFLKDLAAVHQCAQETLHGRHQEEIKHAGLQLKKAMPDEHLCSLREITVELISLAEEMWRVHCHVKGGTSQEAYYQRRAPLEKELVQPALKERSQSLQTTATKLVKQEHLKQIRVFKILDVYNHIQEQNCQEAAWQAMDSVKERVTGQEAAEEAGHMTEEKQIQMVIASLRKCQEAEFTNIDSGGAPQVELENIQLKLKLEHRVRTEELLQIKEKQILHEGENQGITRHKELLVYNLVSQRHFRQTVQWLQDGFQIKKQNSKTSIKNVQLDMDVLGPLADGEETDLLQIARISANSVSLFTDLQLTIELLQLKEGQLRDLALELNKNCPDKAHVQQLANEANLVADALHEFYEQQLRRMKENLKIILAEKRKKDKIKRSLYPLQIKRSLPDAENYRQKEMLELVERKQLELEQSHRLQITGERLKLQDQLERGELSGIMKQKLIKEHEETIAFLEKTFQQDLEQAKRKLVFEKKKKEREEERKNSVTESSRASEKDKRLEQQVLALLSENIRLFKEAEQVASFRMTLLNPQLHPQPLLDNDLSKAVESSPLLKLLKELDEQLKVHAESAGILQNEKTTKGPNYRDVFDSNLTCSDRLISVHPQTLNAREFVIYQFGISLLELLKAQIKAPDIRLSVASSLPQNNYQGNAFANSFFYEKSDKALYVARAYLDSVGSFSLLMVHCVAHITAGNINQDSNPLFLKLFYQALKVCFSDAFFVKLRSSALLKDTRDSKLISDILLKGEPYFQERTDLLSQLFLAKIHSSTLHESATKRVKDTTELLAHHKFESLLKCRLAAMKKNFITQGCQEGHLKTKISPPYREEPEEELDLLHEELLKILQREQLVKGSSASEDQLTEISLEKQFLLKEIEELEAKIGMEESRAQ